MGLLPVPPLPNLLLPTLLAMLPQILLSPQCILTSMESRMTTAETTSSRLSPEMDIQPPEATLLLFPTAGFRLSTMSTMEMELFRMSPIVEFLSMDQLLLLHTLLLSLTLLPTMPLLTLLLLPTLLLVMLSATPSSMVKQDRVIY